MKKSKKKEQSKPAQVQPQEVPFDVWWALTAPKGNFKPYLKEIMVADFKSRGLSKCETMDTFNEALRLFGYVV